MKSIIFKISSFVAGLMALFFYGYNAGKRKQQQKKIELENENLQENIKIIKESVDLSFNDYSKRLLSKQKNNNNK